MKYRSSFPTQAALKHCCCALCCCKCTWSREETLWWIWIFSAWISISKTDLEAYTWVSRWRIRLRGRKCVSTGAGVNITPAVCFSFGGRGGSSACMYVHLRWMVVVSVRAYFYLQSVAWTSVQMHVCNLGLEDDQIKRLNCAAFRSVAHSVKHITLYYCG